MGCLLRARMKPASTLVLVEVPVEIGRRELDLHVREAALEIMKARDQPFQGDRHVDLDRELVVGRGGRKMRVCDGDLVEGIANRRDNKLPRLGEFCAPGVALKS